MSARFLAIWLGLLACCGLNISIAAEEDEQPPRTATEDANTSDSATDEKEATEETDPFAVPEGTNKELLEYIDGLRGMRPRGSSREEMIESFKKAGVAMNAAADKILANDPDKESKSAAMEVKLEALSRLAQFEHKGAEESLMKLVAELKAGSDEALATRAQAVLLQSRARKLMSGNVEGAKELLEEVTAQLKADPDDKAAVRLAMGIGQALEYSGKTDDLAIEAYRSFGEILAKSSDPEIQSYAEQLAGVVRRLELVGHPMEISGTLLDGKPFDPKTLKGKVVLVDFWATWCGPCIAELPNVLSNYEKYHSKGFDVVGISLDNDREALETFVKDRELPWPILYEDGEDSTGWANPLAKQYGIMGIPTVILIGADGKVVSLNARGEKLGELLEKQLGPAEESVE